MNESRKNYKRKCGRRSVDFYLHEQDLLEYSRKIGFARFVKNALCVHMLHGDTYQLDIHEVKFLIESLETLANYYMNLYCQTANTHYLASNRRIMKITKSMEEWEEKRKNG